MYKMTSHYNSCTQKNRKRECKGFSTKKPKVCLCGLINTAVAKLKVLWDRNQKQLRTDWIADCRKLKRETCGANIMQRRRESKLL